MSCDLEVITGSERRRTRRAEVTACPACHARLTYRRSLPAPLDACGFESYALDCPGCGATLAGVVDPLDDKLLLTVVMSSVSVAKIAPAAEPTLMPTT
jgi:hypothetical protein